MKAAEQLEGLHIPHLDYPWKSECSPYVEQIEEQLHDWATRHGLIQTEQAQAHITQMKYAWLAARCYPQANQELLTAIGRHLVWFFLVDDFYVDHAQTLNQEAAPALLSLIDVLDLERVSPEPVYGEEAWFDVCQALRRHLSREHFNRFATGMRLWLMTAALQTQQPLQSVRTRTYLTLRRHASGVNPCATLLDAANSGPLSPTEYHDANLQQLILHANNVVSWSNDLYSLLVELGEPGQPWNLIVVRCQEGYSLQESIDLVAQQIRREIESFQHLATQLDPQASPEMRGTISGLRNWMRGFQDWVQLDTQRYTTENTHTIIREPQSARRSYTRISS